MPETPCKTVVLTLDLPHPQPRRLNLTLAILNLISTRDEYWEDADEALMAARALLGDQRLRRRPPYADASASALIKSRLERSRATPPSNVEKPKDG